MLTLKLTEINDGKNKWMTAIGDEIIVPRASKPTAEACQVLAARGVTGNVRVTGVGAAFVVDIEKVANFRPSAAARRVSAHQGVSNNDN